MIDPVICLNRTQRSAANGNAIVEYILPAILVVALSVAALSAIGAGLNGKFGTMKTTMQSKINGAQQQNQVHLAQKNAFQPAGSFSVTSGGSGKGGTTGTLPPNLSGLSPADISKIIQTAGANGGTETLALALQKYAQQLLASGTLTPDQANILTKLANAGHDLAAGEKALQDAVNNGQSTVNYNGQTYSVADFQAQFGFNDSSGGINNASNMNASAAVGQTAPFMNLYQQAVSSGALSDPTVSAQITSLSKQIAALSELAKFNTTTSATDLSYGYVTAMQQVGVTNAPVTISGQTNTNSGQICNTGSGTDSGTACSN